jgi:putative ABC transport system ATP-binding protein
LTAPALKLCNLVFAWPGGEILLDFEHLELARGERAFLAGSSGSGKSTLLGIVGGILKPRAGSVEVLGTRIDRMPAGHADRFRGDHIGFVFQSFNLLPYLSVLANVLLPLQFSPARRLRVESPKNEAHRLLSALGLGDRKVLAQPVNELSIGQQQRVAAARALIGRPELLIADEPTSSLDADTREDFLTLLMDECRTFGSSVLFVSHDRGLARLFDRRIDMAVLNPAARVLRAIPCRS